MNKPSPKVTDVNPEDTTKGTELEHNAIVLLVDDQPMVGEGIRRMLENEESIEFHYCEDPTQALETAIKVKATVILQDLVMPDVDGMTLMRFYKNHPDTKNIPVIVLSSKENAEVKSDAFTNGANDYLEKLPDPIELIARIKAHSKHYLTEVERNVANRVMREMQMQLEKANSELENHNSELQRLSSLDGLTGIANRRSFDEAIKKEWCHSHRTGGNAEISLLLIDIDYFKPYNDGYGHQSGDDCLKKVAWILSGCTTRACDLFARYGGEEFVAILVGTDTDGAMAVAQKMHDALKQQAIAHEYSEVADIVTISLGVATMIPSRDNKPEELIEAADKALYNAKESGRNQTISATD